MFVSNARILVALLLSLALAAAGSLHVSAAEQQVPAFRTHLDLVRIDATVLDRARVPVCGLTARDFAIFDNGRERPVGAFWAFRIDDRPGASPTAGEQRTSPDVASNVLDESRLFALVLDDALIPHDARIVANARHIGQTVIDRLVLQDKMAVVFTASTAKGQDFTGDREKLNTAVTALSPGLANWQFGYESGLIPPPADTDGYLYLSSLRAVQGVVDSLAEAPDKRKVVVWVSPGLPLNWEEAGPRLTGAESRVTIRELMTTMISATRELFAKAAIANVAIYSIDPAGLHGFETYLASRPRVPRDVVHERALDSLDFLQAVSANTGGRALVNSDAFEPGIAAIFQENACSYLIGFAPDDADTKPTFHKVDVTVNRSGVEVRARRGYYSHSQPVDAAASEPGESLLARALSGILPLRDVQLEAAVAPFAVAEKRIAAILVALKLRHPATAVAAGERATAVTEVRADAYTPDGRRVATQTQTARIVLHRGSAGEACYEVFLRMDLSPGRYQLRLAALSREQAKVGSVFVDLTVPDFQRERFTISGVVLAALPPLPGGPRDVATPILPIVPTASREFSPSDTVTALLRVYQNGQTSPSPAALSVTIVNASNHLETRETATLQPSQFVPAIPANGGAGATQGGAVGVNSRAGDVSTNGLRTAQVRYRIPVDRLAPGRYFLTFQIDFAGRTEKRAVGFSVR